MEASQPVDRLSDAQESCHILFLLFGFSEEKFKFGHEKPGNFGFKTGLET